MERSCWEEATDHSSICRWFFWFARCFIKTYIIYSNSLGCWVSLQFHCRPTTVDSPQSPVESRLDVIIESQRRPAVPTCYYRNDSSLFAFMFSSRPNQRDNYLCWSWSWTADRRQQTLPARCVFDLRLAATPVWVCACVSADVNVSVCVSVSVCAPVQGRHSSVQLGFETGTATDMPLIVAIHHMLGRRCRCGCRLHLILLH